MTCLRVLFVSPRDRTPDKVTSQTPQQSILCIRQSGTNVVGLASIRTACWQFNGPKRLYSLACSVLLNEFKLQMVHQRRNFWLRDDNVYFENLITGALGTARYFCRWGSLPSSYSTPLQNLTPEPG